MIPYTIGENIKARFARERKSKLAVTALRDQFHGLAFSERDITFFVLERLHIIGRMATRLDSCLRAPGVVRIEFRDRGWT